MKKSKIAVIALATTMLIPLVSSNPVGAVPMAQNQQISEAQTTINELEAKIQILDNEISSAQIELEEQNKKISDLNSQIEEAEVKLVSTQSELEISKSKMNGRVREMYKNGDTSILSVFLTSESIGDIVSRFDAFSKVNDMDREIVDTYTSQVDELNRIEEKLKTDKTDLEVLLSEIESTKTELDSKKETALAEIQVAKDREAQLRQTASIPETAVAAVGNSGNAAINNTPAPSANGNAILETASQYLGTPYLWGGSSPAGFDCSGFTSYVFKQHGISIGRTTYDQIGRGVSVSLSNLQPGDLVFFGSASAPYHVGIYWGDGQYIHSPQTGDVVRISSLSGRNCSAARRVY